MELASTMFKNMPTISKKHSTKSSELICRLASIMRPNDTIKQQPYTPDPKKGMILLIFSLSVFKKKPKPINSIKSPRITTCVILFTIIV
ncbi:unnamed protein product [Arctia plantaginis]|uniref:Uncharacterized protein n=1 Tax=Arctia plantaginis TaxID=874455 RepID=A0A8S0YZM3_ARCPL|nr:unnamed protein product [Arctia plantaginis]